MTQLMACLCLLDFDFIISLASDESLVQSKYCATLYIYYWMKCYRTSWYLLYYSSFNADYILIWVVIFMLFSAVLLHVRLFWTPPGRADVGGLTFCMQKTFISCKWIFCHLCSLWEMTHIVNEKMSIRSSVRTSVSTIIINVARSLYYIYISLY